MADFFAVFAINEKSIIFALGIVTGISERVDNPLKHSLIRAPSEKSLPRRLLFFVHSLTRNCNTVLNILTFGCLESNC